MKSLKIEDVKRGWTYSFVLSKCRKEEYILQIQQFNAVNFREAYILGNNSVRKLKDFLNENLLK